jgi:hypothetical protein
VAGRGGRGPDPTLDVEALRAAVAASARRLGPIPAGAPVVAAYAIGTVAAFWSFARVDAMFF